MKAIQLQTIAHLIGSNLTIQITSGVDILLESRFACQTEDINKDWLKVEILRAFNYALDNIMKGGEP